MLRSNSTQLACDQTVSYSLSDWQTGFDPLSCGPIVLDFLFHDQTLSDLPPHYRTLSDLPSHYVPSPMLPSAVQQQVSGCPAD